ncbi:type II toxin-antitoxin system prevent-host-death family antitoxin [Mycobacterium sp.]|jgi:prevent-host-death family protein|uniref:type II toxin-antitoxin system Phd/YefM family antitoxin n=1 Tax=Mycobacterium sp. TaxID=1785 RepID=UPI00341896FE
MGELIGLGQLRSNAIGYLERVLAGETIEVVRRGRLVARIVSAAGDRSTPTALPDLVAVNGADGRIGLEALRNSAGRYFDRVEAGQTIWIVWRGKLVARVVSATRNPEASPIPTQPVNVAARDAGGRVGLDELRTHAGRYLDRVAEGETIEVVRGGRVVARIVSAAEDPRRTA